MNVLIQPLVTIWNEKALKETQTLRARRSHP